MSQTDAAYEREARQAIADLLVAFDDAILVGDRARFLSLWTPDAVWEIGQYNPNGTREITPLRAQGVDQLGAAFDNFAAMNVFFFRGTLAPMVRHANQRAMVRVPTFELATRRDGSAYMNVAFYLDRLELRNGRWLFAERRYDYLWVDSHARVAGAAVPLSDAAKNFFDPIATAAAHRA